MKLSKKWLADFTNITADDKEYADRLTITGSKVEGTADLGADVKNVVLGKMISVERHPDADSLWVCTVDIGAADPTVIVTGADNLKAGDVCPVALHKSKLPCGKEIKKGKIRGVESNGMLCSLDELCLDLHDYPHAAEDGILVFTADEIKGFQLGDDIRPVFGMDDKVVEFEITSNRPDCLSVIGLARESAASFDVPMTVKESVVQGSGGDILDYLDAEIWDEDLCRRFTARVVKNVKIAPSPVWMRQRLRAAGVRPINNIVDITNYVMLEYGQPMHAFDHACLQGGQIIVRRSGSGEIIRTLDGVDRELDDALVIADEEKAVGIAGVMGGARSEITDSTTTVVFESANFNGVSIRKTAARLGMRTDASGRFEKGLDPMSTLPAVQRACELVELLGAGEVVDGIVDVIASDRLPVSLPLEADKINALLGTKISRDNMAAILEKVGFTVDNSNLVTVPSWRLDVHQWADLAEEVARFYGYNVIPATMMRGAAVQGGFNPRQKLERQVGVLLRNLGYNEILTYTFTGQVAYDKVRLSADAPERNSLTILNPLGEDTSRMRTIAMPAMLETLARNASYRNESARLYELGRVYLPNAESETLCDERLHLTLGAYGNGADFFALKGAVEALLEDLRITGVIWTAKSDDPIYHPGRCAELAVDDQVLGRLGQVHPLTCKNFGLEGEVFAAELDLEELFAAMGPERTYVPLPRFPAVTRDIAVVCDEHVTAQELQAVIAGAGVKKLVESRLFDVYTGTPIPAGKKSMAFALQYRAEDRTLTDEDADGATAKILTALETKLGAVIR
ncbi:MAG: phenylalanine--tRNA ligase subunit beta [Oscillospiraceae bacterium]|nr:phenylalanine--tRNA ligase subunit beta [Oscillospiraceae bacterium]